MYVSLSSLNRLVPDFREYEYLLAFSKKDLVFSVVSKKAIMLFHVISDLLSHLCIPTSLIEVLGELIESLSNLQGLDKTVLMELFLTACSLLFCRNALKLKNSWTTCGLNLPRKLL